MAGGRYFFLLQLPTESQAQAKHLALLSSTTYRLLSRINLSASFLIRQKDFSPPFDRLAHFIHCSHYLVVAFAYTADVMRDWGKVAVREGGGGTDVVANVFARGRVVLDDDKGGGGAVGGEGGLTREWNGKGFIDLGVVEVGKRVEEVLIMWLRDCELATKFISPVLSLTLFFPVHY